MSEGGPILSLSGISKRYGALEVLQSLTLSIRSGDRVLVLGRNGSGKSTLLRVCAGLIQAEQGERVAPPQLSYFGHAALLYARLSVFENIELFCALQRSAMDPHTLIENWELGAVQRTPFRELSKGLQARVSLCRTFAAPASLLLLDEPSSALDEIGVSHLLRQFASTQTIRAAIIATHDLTRLMSWTNRIVVLEQGKIALDSAALGSGPAALEQAISFYRQENR